MTPETTSFHVSDDDLFLALAVACDPERVGELARQVRPRSDGLTEKARRISQAPRPMVQQVGMRLLASIGVSIGEFFEPPTTAGMTFPHTGVSPEVAAQGAVIQTFLSPLLSLFSLSEALPRTMPESCPSPSMTFRLSGCLGTVHFSVSEDLLVRTVCRFLRPRGLAFSAASVCDQIVRVMVAKTLLDNPALREFAEEWTLSTHDVSKSADTASILFPSPQGGWAAVSSSTTLLETMLSRQRVQLSEGQCRVLDAISVAPRLRVTCPVERLQLTTKVRLLHPRFQPSPCSGELLVSAGLTRRFTGTLRVEHESLVITVEQVEDSHVY